MPLSIILMLVLVQLLKGASSSSLESTSKPTVIPITPFEHSPGGPLQKKIFTNASVSILPASIKQIQWKELKNGLKAEGGNYFLQRGKHKVKLTLIPQLQAKVQSQLDQIKQGSAAIVLMDPKTGRILAIGEKLASDSLPGEYLIDRSKAPAASLMKIVTAAAALDADKELSPDTEIPFRGGCSKLHRENWIRGLQDREKMTLALAFGSSCNTVFARLAIYYSGLKRFAETALNFYFNKPIPSDLNFENSSIFIPSYSSSSPLEVGEVGAGFGDSKLNPVHSAMLSAAAANGGILMAPHLIDQITDESGKALYIAKPKVLGEAMTQDVAQKMLALMRETIRTGTGRHLFARRVKRRKGQVQLFAKGREDQLQILGKTGTLSDFEDRSTLYTWFSGVVIPNFSTTSLSIGALIASPKSSVVRASHVAQMTLLEYLRWARLEKTL